MDLRLSSRVVGVVKSSAGSAPRAVRGYTPSRARWPGGEGAHRVAADGRAERARGARDLRALRAPPHGAACSGGRGRASSICSGGRGRASSAAACPPSGGRTPRSSTTARRPRTRVGKRPWAGRSRGRRCTPAFCVRGVGARRRRACERRAAAAGWQVALAAAKFARLRTLDWTLVL